MLSIDLWITHIAETSHTYAIGIQDIFNLSSMPKELTEKKNILMSILIYGASNNKKDERFFG